MDKSEAAAFLGISIRTLERLVATGKLPKKRALKDSRRVVIFDKADVEKAKKELDLSRPAEVFRRLNSEKPKDAIGFRLDPFYVAMLKEKGEKRGLSASEFARKLVIQGLEETQPESAEAQMRTLRRNLADMFYILLVTKIGASEEEATEIVNSLTEEPKRNA